MKKKVLFFIESISFAHYSRCIELARNLPQDQFDVLIAVDNHYSYDVDMNNIEFIEIKTITPSFFKKCLKTGEPYFPKSTLEKYIKNDIEVMEKYRPDLVVGDFHLSLNWSARILNIPYITLTNAYWDVDYKKSKIVPELAIIKYINPKFMLFITRFYLNHILGNHVKIYNEIDSSNKNTNKNYKSITDVFFDADKVLYFDFPEFINQTSLPLNHHFIGGHNIELRSSTKQLEKFIDEKKILIFMNLGSSGSTEKVLDFIDDFSLLPFQFVIAKADRKMNRSSLPKNVFVGDYLPGKWLCEKADIVLTNGGSASTYQVLASGKPLICLPSNLDQHLFISHLNDKKIGIFFRTENVTSEKIIQSIYDIISNDTYTQNAKNAQKVIVNRDPINGLMSCISELTEFSGQNDVLKAS